jgi:hypothetical protein
MTPHIDLRVMKIGDPLGDGKAKTAALDLTP